MTESMPDLGNLEREVMQLIWAGGPLTAEAVREKLERRLKESTVRTVLRRLEENADKVRALHSVDVFVAPNTGGESFGIVLAEAMSAGAPILASDIEAFRRVLLDGRAGALFPVGDAEALAATAAELLDDPPHRKQLSAEAKTAVLAYDWSTVARDVLQLTHLRRLRQFDLNPFLRRAMLRRFEAALDQLVHADAPNL